MMRRTERQARSALFRVQRRASVNHRFWSEKLEISSELCKPLRLHLRHRIENVFVARSESEFESCLLSSAADSRTGLPQFRQHTPLNVFSSTASIASSSAIRCLRCFDLSMQGMAKSGSRQQRRWECNRTLPTGNGGLKDFCNPCENLTNESLRVGRRQPTGYGASSISSVD